MSTIARLPRLTAFSVLWFGPPACVFSSPAGAETATPENERCDGRSLWLMVFLMTLSSPLLMLLLKPFIDSEGKNLKDENTDEGEESAFLSKDE